MSNSMKNDTVVEKRKITIYILTVCAHNNSRGSEKHFFETDVSEEGLTFSSLI